jgi:hypothetical protein
VAQERLQIRLDAVDSTKKAFSSLKSSIFNIRNALAGIGIGLVVKQFVDTGKQVEKLATRFRFLFGSVEEGKRAFDTLTKFAAKVPFSLEEISAASGNLAVVSKDANELAKILEITGNVAAVTGLDFQTTASQIQRSFSGGIAAADVFREKGVRALLGFEAGATISAEATAKRFEEVFGKGGRFGTATGELAKTFEGTLSMLGDKLFKFKKDVADSAFFETLKDEFSDLNQFLEDNSGYLTQFAMDIGKTLASAVQFLSNSIKFVYENLTIFTNAVRIFIGLGLAVIVANIITKFVRLREVIKGTSVAMALLNSLTKKNILFAAGAVVFGNLDKIAKKLKELGIYLGVFSKDYGELDDGDFTGDGFRLSKEELQKTLSPLEIFKNAVTDIRLKFKEINDEALKKLKGGIDVVAKIASDAVKSLSQGIAESIVLGKKLGETFRDVVQKAIINLLATYIEIGLRQLANIAYEAIFGKKIDDNTDKQKKQANTIEDIITRNGADLLIHRQKTAEIERQNRLLSEQAGLGGNGGAMPFNIGGFGGDFGGGQTGGIGSMVGSSIGSSIGYQFGGPVGGTIGSVLGKTLGKILPFAEGGRVNAGQAITVGERGRELFVPSTDGQIIRNEDLGGRTNVNFTINAVDVAGIKELLIDNRATIVNLVNSALNQRGKASLV